MMIKNVNLSIIKKWFLTFLLSIPIVFVLVFYGYFPINFDVVLHTNNIIGEGICQTYLCPSTGFANFYSVSFYFGSELKKATIKGYHYDVESIQLIVSDVSEFEITKIDTYIKGIHLAHFEPIEILPEGEMIEGNNTILLSQNGVLHVTVKDPGIGSTIIISKQFIPTWFWFSYFSFMFLISFFVTILFNYIFERIPQTKIIALSSSCIIVTLLSGSFFCGSLSYISYVNFLLNWLFLFAFSLLLNAITLPFLGTALTMVFTTFWYVANYFVITLRNKPIMPADLKAIGTAKEVLGGYTFTPSWKMILGLFIVGLYIAILIVTWKEYKQQHKQTLKKQLIWRSSFAAFAIILAVLGINTKIFKSLNSFAWDMMLLKSFHQEGMIATYIKSVINSKVKKPEGYSRELVNSYLLDYQSEQNISGIQPTNIIMIMNEAFSDLRIVGLDSSIDVMPFIDGLSEDTMKGYLSVSVFGGGTCNTEFESLTGNSLAFLGVGAYPYTENVTNPMFSLASYFKKMGYNTNAFHPNEPQNWNRNMVYPNLGFDKFNSISDFEAFGEVVKLHNLPADINDYKLIQSVDSKYVNQPSFLFDVTMQNHSGYERWLDVEKPESVEQYGNNLYLDTQIYLSLIKASDDEIKQLIEEYKNIDEPTMIVFFGDHQPGLPGIAMQEIYTDLDSQLDLYKTKFFIWTNYDTEEQEDVMLSANYLPWLILERGNFQLPPYVQMLKEVYSKYPIISSQGVMDSKGNVYTGIAEVMDDPLIKKYQYIQYANMFDEIDEAWFYVD